MLDLYAGSGALGLEALSRGAASATLVEHDPAAVAVLHDNVAHLGLPGAHVVAVDVERWLAVDPEPRYDLALLDPPYELDVAPVLDLLLPWLADDARRRRRARRRAARSSSGRSGSSRCVSGVTARPRSGTPGALR